MARRNNIDERLSAVMRTRREALSPASIDTLRVALADSHSVIVEHAARAAGELLAGQLIPELSAAFARCLSGGLDDRSSLAATAVADAMQTLRADEPELYLRGLKMRRPTMPRGDAASGVRSACAFGLVRCNYRHSLWALAELLHDEIPECRIAAARAMAGTDGAMALLKYKVLVGDRESDVTVECLGALGQLDPALAVPFLAEQLDSDDPTVREGAALALGQTRRPEVLSILAAKVERGLEASFRQVLLTSIALLRNEAALAFLIDQAAKADPHTAAAAVGALALYKHDPSLRTRVAGAVERAPAAVKEAFEREFG